MARKFVASSGTPAAPNDTWATAYNDLQTALTACAAGDECILGISAVPSGDAELAANATYTIPDGVSLICSTISGTADVTPTAMGTTYWIGNSTTGRNVTINATFDAFIYGLTIRQHGTGVLALAQTDNSGIRGRDIRLWNSSTSSNASPSIGATNNTYVELENLVMQWDRVSMTSNINWMGRCVLRNLSFVLAGSSIGGNPFAQNSVSGILDLTVEDSDVSNVGNVTLINAAYRGSSQWLFRGVILPSAYTLHANLAGGESEAADRVILVDCKSGSTQIGYEYHNAMGSLTLDTAIKYTGTPANASWKIVTTAKCARQTPFNTPWIEWQNPGVVAITPRFEVVRNDSTSAYSDALLWGQFSAAVVASSPRGTIYTDVAGVGAAGTDQAAGAGLTAWEGESGTAWSGKVDSGSALTPASGYKLYGRVSFGAASATVYVDPMIRT
jgi:hypothetical protein